MINFFMIAALMLALALCFVLPGLLRKEMNKAFVQSDILNAEILRDQLCELDGDLQIGSIDGAGYQNARRELERRLAENVGVDTPSAKIGNRQYGTAFVLLLAVPIISGALYYFLGAPSALNEARVAGIEVQSPVTAKQIEAMVNGLAEKLKSKPGDVDGWRMLARSYERMERFDKAVEAYEHLLQLMPNNAELLTNYAVTLAIASNRSLLGGPEKLINRALEADPNNVQALALSGSAAFERKDYAAAIKSWKRILMLAPPESELARTIMRSIAKAESLDL